MLKLPPRLRRLERLQVFRYGVAAGIATVIDISLYTLLSTQVFLSDVHLFGLTGTPHAVSLIISFSAGLITNFLITKYYVFRASNQSTLGQFIRFVLVSVVVFWANKFFMDLLYYVVPGILPLKGELLKFSVRTVSALSIGVVSFLSHRMFTYRAHKAPATTAQPEGMTSREKVVQR